MMLKKWEKLPENMRIPEVRKYYDILRKRRFSLFCKRVFDIVVSSIMLILFSPLFLILAIAIKIDSRGPVFYRQVRVTQYGKKFRIFKFRSMVNNADKGSQVTVNNDMRVTRVGKFIRKCRLDEFSQLIDVFRGTMTFVGPRPEVPKYVEQYTPEMMATLLLPAGVTAMSSIYFKDEAEILDGVEDTDKVYVERVLPEKMYYNLREIEKFGWWRDLGTMFKTVFAVMGKKYKGNYPGRVGEDAPKEDEIKAESVTCDDTAKVQSEPETEIETVEDVTVVAEGVTDAQVVEVDAEITEKPDEE